MLHVKNYYQEEAKKTIADITADRYDFLFAVVADSHLDEGVLDTVLNISGVDQACRFDCGIHLGDFMTGNITRSYTSLLLAKQMEMFRGATSGGVFYPVQGNHDGFLENCGRMSADRLLDEDWYAATAFVNGYSNVTRPGISPYYFVDYPDIKLRLIILNTQYYTYDNAAYRFRFGVHDQQLQWLAQEALALETGWTVLLFSHDAPFREELRSPSSTWTNGAALLQTVADSVTRRDIHVAGWFVGHYHGELVRTVAGIPFIVIGSQTSYVPQLWQMPQGGYYCGRQRGTCTEDLWDAVALDLQKQELRLYRFGAGTDRIVSYRQERA